MEEWAETAGINFWLLSVTALSAPLTPTLLEDYDGEGGGALEEENVT